MVADFCTQWSLVTCNTVHKITVFTVNYIVWDCAICAGDFLVICFEDVRNVMQVCVCVRACACVRVLIAFTVK